MQTFLSAHQNSLPMPKISEVKFVRKVWLKMPMGVPPGELAGGGPAPHWFAGQSSRHRMVMESP